MPRLNLNSAFYRSVKSNDTTADRYITFGAHATYKLNTAGAMSIWAKRGAWRSDGENIMELYGTGGYVRISMTGAIMSLTAFANSSTIASTTYTLTSGALEQWHNVVVTWDSTSIDVYLDKAKVITVSGDKQLSFSANPTFFAGAGNAAGSGFFFDGYTTRAALYNAKLSQADVNKIWNTESPSSEVAAWDYTDKSGSTITLTRGAGNNGTIIQGSIQLDVPVRPRVPLRNAAYAVGLTTGKIQASANSGISGASAWTIGGWIFINKINGSATGYDLCFGTAGGGVGSPYVGIDNGSFSLGFTGVINTSTIKAQQYLGKWVHLAGSYSGGTGGTFRLYLNGKQVYAIAYGGTPSLTNGAFMVNNYLNSSSYQLYAAFSGVFWCTTELSETDIYNLANGISIPTVAGYWKLDEGTSNVATDYSGNGTNGTIFSGSWVDGPIMQRNIIQNTPYSVLFNGSTQYGTATINFGSATKLVWDGWVYPANSGTTSQVLTSSDISGQAFEIQYNNTAIAANTFVFLVGVVGVYNYWVSEKIPPNKWYRLTCVYDSAEGVNTRTKVYINGKLSGAISSANNVSPTFGTQTVELAARTSAAIYWKGYIGATRVYTGYAWTAADVLLAAQRNIYPSSGTLKANWGFTDGSGTTITDSSGNGNNITLTNSPTWTINSPLNNRLSIRSFPYSLQFIRGSSTRSSVPYVNLGTSLSYSAWIRPRLNGNAGDIIGVMDTLIRISPTDIKFYTDGTAGYLASVAFNFEHNKLYHLAVTCSGTTVKFYINGTLLGTQTASGAVDTSSTSNFIGYYGIAPQAFEGDIAEITAYSRTLTDAEIAAMYFQNVVPTTNLERYYKLATGSGTTATDSSVNAQNGTITSGTWQPGFFANRAQIT
jgi:hypothetical protein